MLDLFQETLSGTLRVMASGMKIPVMILLVLLAAVTVFLLGKLIVEYFTEHKYLDVQMPALVDQIRASEKKQLASTITDSKLLLRQKAALTELTKHPDLTPMMRESLAIRLIAQEKDFYNGRTRWTDLIAKVAPMLGLMGTLIPLGPGIIALGQGDTYTLSTSLLMAFDTTVAGLACAAVALAISSVRKRWYKNYMSMLETLMECVLEMENGIETRPEKTAAPVEGTVALGGPAPNRQTSEAVPAADPAKQAIIDTYKAAYTQAVRAGYDAESAKAYARNAAMQVMTGRGQMETQGAGAQI